MRETINYDSRSETQEANSTLDMRQKHVGTLYTTSSWTISLLIVSTTVNRYILPRPLAVTNAQFSYH